MSRDASATADLPAIAGGRPVRERPLPLSRPWLAEDGEIAEVVETLRSGWLATGPRTERFEHAFAAFVGQRHAVGVTSGTAALALALEAAGVGPGDEVITTPLTFVATVHAIVHRGARPVLADVDPRTLTLDPDEVARRIGPRTRALLPVHFAGRAAALEPLRRLADDHGLTLIADAAHAIETTCGGRPAAAWADLSAFSFHPAKNLTTGEGGMVTTDDPAWAGRLRRLRLHGVETDAWARREGADAGGASRGALDVTMAGHKCNMSDLQAAIGLHQLRRLPDGHARRERLWRCYVDALGDLDAIELPPEAAPGDRHARHLFTVRVDAGRTGLDRQAFCDALGAEKVATGHHYPAVHTLSWYRRRLGDLDGELPVATDVARRIVSLPLHPAMDAGDVDDVARAVRRLVAHAGRRSEP